MPMNSTTLSLNLPEVFPSVFYYIVCFLPKYSAVWCFHRKPKVFITNLHR